MSEPALTQEQRDLLKILLDEMDKLLNGGVPGPEKKLGFVVLVFKFGDLATSPCEYVSNTSKDSVLAVMKVLVTRLEGAKGVEHGT